MALDIVEGTQAALKIVALAKKGVDFAATIPAGTEPFERDLMIAKELFPDACDLAIEIRRDVKD